MLKCEADMTITVQYDNSKDQPLPKIFNGYIYYIYLYSTFTVTKDKCNIREIQSKGNHGFKAVASLFHARAPSDTSEMPINAVKNAVNIFIFHSCRYSVLMIYSTYASD